MYNYIIMPYVVQRKISKDDCGICYETLKDRTKAVFKLPCGHLFHNNCLNDYCEHEHRIAHAMPDTKCPICREPFDPEQCNTFWAFKNKRLRNARGTADLKKETFRIYRTQTQTQSAGKRRIKNKSKKQRKPRKTRKT
jgi:hypothetical protein